MNPTLTEFNQSTRTTQFPEFRSGDTVKVYRKIMEGAKERTQLFEGMIISVKGRQSASPTITVRKVSDGIGVELILPLFSPAIEKIELVKRAVVRRSKLYYIREKSAKALKFKYRDLSATPIEAEKPISASPKTEIKATDEQVAETESTT